MTVVGSLLVCEGRTHHTRGYPALLTDPWARPVAGQGFRPNRTSRRGPRCLPAIGRGPVCIGGGFPVHRWSVSGAIAAKPSTNDRPIAVTRSAGKLGVGLGRFSSRIGQEILPRSDCPLMPRTAPASTSREQTTHGCGRRTGYPSESVGVRLRSRRTARGGLRGRSGGGGEPTGVWSAERPSPGVEGCRRGGGLFGWWRVVGG